MVAGDASGAGEGAYLSSHFAAEGLRLVEKEKFVQAGVSRMEKGRGEVASVGENGGVPGSVNTHAEGRRRTPRQDCCFLQTPLPVRVVATQHGCPGRHPHSSLTPRRRLSPTIAVTAADRGGSSLHIFSLPRRAREMSLGPWRAVGESRSHGRERTRLFQARVQYAHVQHQKPTTCNWLGSPRHIQ